MNFLLVFFLINIVITHVLLRVSRRMQRGWEGAGLDTSATIVALPVAECCSVSHCSTLQQLLCCLEYVFICLEIDRDRQGGTEGVRESESESERGRAKEGEEGREGGREREREKEKEGKRGREKKERREDGREGGRGVKRAG